MSDVWRAAGPRLVPGRDLHIIGCRRPPTGHCLGLRWASRVDLGLPISGYRVSRRALPQGQAEEIGTFFLPDTSSWQAFAKDAEIRRPRCGPYFSEIEEKAFVALLPVIRLCDPRIPASEAHALIERAAAFFGETHRGDAELAFQFWRFSAVPKLGDLLQNPQAAAAIERFYRRQCLALLLVLALRFEYAVLFGLATDDDRPGQGDVVYRVQAAFAASQGVAESDPVLTNAICAPSPPAWLTAERVPGGVLYPTASLWPYWRSPPGLEAMDEQGNPLPAFAGWPKVPAALTGLAWAEPAPESKLIGHGPVLYRVGRYAHGAASAALPTAPMLPANAVFVPLGGGEDLIRDRHEPHFIDTPNMPAPPLEGHYHYEVKGVDLLGVASAGGPRTSLRHHDDLPPPAPRVANTGEPVRTLEDGASHVEVPFRVFWEAAEDFGGPDVVEFRVAASFRSLRGLSLQVESVTDAAPLHADLSIASLPVAAQSLVGAHLSLPSGEYPIISHGSGAHAALRVRKVRGRMPEAGADGLVFALAAPTPVTRVAHFARRPMEPATVAAVVSIDPLVIELAPAPASVLSGNEPLSIYLHVLGAGFVAERVGPLTFRLAPPRPETPLHVRWSQWLDLAQPRAALVGSPALLFPRHDFTASVALPFGFIAGTLSLHVTAADGTAYVASPVLPVADAALTNARGNESARAALTLSLRTQSPPEEVVVGPFDPDRWVWAKSAANYAEDATYRLAWPAVAAAVRYEVWRVLESAVPGATRATGDVELRAFAAAAGKFTLRSDRVFGTSFVDGLPGRAPVRGLYRVRAVSAAGGVGPFSEIIGPVHVPDVRPPATPNLLRVAAAPPEEAERTIVVEWTAGGGGADVRFEVWFAGADDPGAAMQLAGTLPAGSAANGDGRHRFLHGNRRPGKREVYEVRAIREALDPIDAAAMLRRDIASLPSRRLSAAALFTGSLAAPEAVTAAATPGGVLLSWTLSDPYEAIEVRRRAPDRYGFEVIGRLPGDAASFLDTTATGGVFTYQLRAIGMSRVANGADLVVEVA